MYKYTQMTLSYINISTLPNYSVLRMCMVYWILA